MLVKALKLISGEELVGEVISESETNIVIKNPLAIMLSRTRDGDLSIGFVPFAPYLGEKIELSFDKERTLFCKEVDEKMQNQYSNIFGGIVTPPKKLILG